MRYHNSDFIHENLILRRSPANAREAHNKLLSLAELEEWRSGNDLFTMRKPSKRRTRLVKTYWAFRRKEVRV